MIAAPAVDLRGGRCVQLVGGRPEEERVSLPDPVGVALDWAERGFHTLHVVDLDAALGTGENRETIEAIVEATPAEVQVGGGIRDDEIAHALLETGVARLIVGTRAVDEPEWVAGLARAHPGRVMVAADTRGGRVLRRGWTEASELPLLEFVAALAETPLAGILCTDVTNEGRLAGTDLEQAGALAGASPHPVWISGGIRSLADLRALAAAGAHGAVLGMALYTGVLDAREVAEEFGG